MAFTFVSDGVGNVYGGGSSFSSATVQLTGVHAGDLIVLGGKWEGGDTTVTCSDSTSSLTSASFGHMNSAGGSDPYGVMFYLLSSVATGTVTYTFSFTAARVWIGLVGMCFTPSGAVSLDGTASKGGSQTLTSMSSGNITTSSSDGLAVAFYAEFGNSLNAPQINGLTPDHTKTDGGASVQNDTMWSKTYASGFTGAATGTISAANSWALGVIGFQISGGGGASDQLDWQRNRNDIDRIMRNYDVQIIN